jgi:hypothetical protein
MNLNGLLGSLLSPTSGRPAPLALPPPQDDKAKKPDAPNAGVMAQISDAARSLWAQMQQSGVTDASFDLHLDLKQLGMSVDAKGNRSFEGHSLTVDLHVEAHRGSLKTSDGQDASFQSLDMSYTLEQTDITATEQGNDAQGAAPAAGDKPAGPPPSAHNQGLIDGLKKLIDLLDKSNGQSDQIQGLGDLLAQIGHALEDMAKRFSDKLGQADKPGQLAPPPAPGAGDGPDQSGQTQQYQEDVHIHAVHVQMVAVQDAQKQAA